MASFDLVQSWLNAAGRYPILPREEVLRLAKRRDTLEPGSKAYIKVVNKICQHNLRLVPDVVRKYLAKRKGFSMSSDVASDLLQQGYIGLRRAAEKYDAKRGFAFATYAHPWVYQAVTRWHNSRDRLIYIPENAMCEVLYRARHGKPSKSKNGKISENVISSARQGLDVYSIDVSVTDQDDNTLLSDIISQEHSLIDHNTAPDGAGVLKLKDLMAECGIRPKVQDIVLLRARCGRLATTASKLRLSREYCSAQYAEAVRTMQAKVQEKEAARQALLADRLSK